MITLVEVLQRTETFLRERGIPSPRFEAEQLLSQVLEMPRLQLYLHFDRPLTEDDLGKLRPMVARRGKREPLAWILGTWGFHALDLETHPGVLVPRPDTETLVEVALARIPEDADPVYVVDVGCGTGAVGLAVAHARPGVRVYAVDLSPAAIANTKANVKALGLESRVAVLQGKNLDPIPAVRPIDWVLSNPPYIPSRTIDGLQPEVSLHEPRLALDGGNDGLACYRELLPPAMKRARIGVAVEIGFDQGPQVADLFRRLGALEVEVHRDLGGNHRVVSGLVPSGQ